MNIKVSFSALVSSTAKGLDSPVTLLLIKKSLLKPLSTIEMKVLDGVFYEAFSCLAGCLI